VLKIPEMFVFDGTNDFRSVNDDQPPDRLNHRLGDDHLDNDDRRREQCREATRRWRARARRHVALVPIEVNERTIDLLVRMQWLDGDARSKVAIKAAIEAMLDDAYELMMNGREMKSGEIPPL
jgi:hypothetical protein